MIDAESGEVRRRIPVGPKPNGLAWDARRRRLLVADVQDLRARLIDPLAGRDLADVALPGRPRWCVYDPAADRFLVNIREPACVAVLAADSLAQQGLWAVPAAGPHGLDIDLAHRRAFVACDGGAVVALDADEGRELGAVPIAGEPDAIWYDPGRSRLYVAIGDPGEIAVVDTESMTLAQEIATEPGAHTTAFDRTRGRLYVFLPRSHRAAILQTA